MVPAFKDHRDHLLRLVEAALAAAEPDAAVSRHLHRNGFVLSVGRKNYDLAQRRVVLVSVGKAAVPMAGAVLDVLADELDAGIVIAKHGTEPVQGGNALSEAGFPLRVHSSSSRISYFEGSHPVSGPENVRATAAVIELLSQLGTGDLLLCCISGGTSALLTQPRLPLQDWQELNGALLASGCTIQEFNTVRKQLDAIKGGGLAHVAAPAACVSLILSDVVGNPLDMIGSGPTVPDRSTAAGAREILERYRIADRLSSAAWTAVLQALSQVPDRPQLDRALLHNLIVCDVGQAAMAALARAAQLGFVGQVLTKRLEGEAREVGRVVAAVAKDAGPGRCLLLGGETTVTLKGEGVGGRNQELALAMAIALEGWPAIAAATLATDGEDGTTGAAGAIVTGSTATRARELGLDPLEFLDRNDSHSFFSRLGAGPDSLPALITPGSTGTNVNDLVFVLTYPVGGQDQL